MSATANAGIDKRFPAVPLAATCALHLLFVLCWLARPLPGGPADSAPQVVSVLVPLPGAPTPRPVPHRPANRAADPAAPAPKSRTRPAAVSAAPSPAVVPAPGAPAAAAADTAPAAPHTETAEELLRSARKQAGAIDRELRGGRPGVPQEPGTPWSGVRSGLAAAHIDRSRTAVTDSYTGPDGVTIYRIRQGDKVYCRATGSAALPMPGRTEGAVLAGAGRFDNLGQAGTGGSVNCPSSERDWVRR
jgi:hypothetical protein